MFVKDSISISDLPRECIDECSASGDVTETVAYWQSKLELQVEREPAVRCLKGYGAWDEDELWNADDDTLAQRILWLACGDFSDFIVHAEEEGIDPFAETPECFQPSSGSNIFVME